MSETVIHVENLSKEYHIGKREKYRTFGETLTTALSAPLRRLTGSKAVNVDGGEESFWALKDINFEVKAGEVIGIIGRNGAGKSTLLKILSRITEPTTGNIEIIGRVSSLLEVGTGFHPELTGRENIYLNGAILGMRKSEVARKFDEIVDFSEISDFLDTPVKRYSSGMHTRLAFAVAAHLEPEILIMDEVLAVGDAQFQKKCLGKMGEVARGGRTVLFVSHNMAAVKKLCAHAMVLSGGHASPMEPVLDALQRYLRTGVAANRSTEDGWFWFKHRINRYASGELLIQAAGLFDSDNHSVDTILMGTDLFLKLRIKGLQKNTQAQVGIIVKSSTEEWLANFNTGMKPASILSRDEEEIVSVQINRFPFVPGRYWIDISVAEKAAGRLDYVERAIELTVEQNDVYKTGYSASERDGVVFIDGLWTISSAQSQVTA